MVNFSTSTSPKLDRDRRRRCRRCCWLARSAAARSFAGGAVRSPFHNSIISLSVSGVTQSVESGGGAEPEVAMCSGMSRFFPSLARHSLTYSPPSAAPAAKPPSPFRPFGNSDAN